MDRTLTRLSHASSFGKPSADFPTLRDPRSIIPVRSHRKLTPPDRSSGNFHLEARRRTATPPFRAAGLHGPTLPFPARCRRPSRPHSHPALSSSGLSPRLSQPHRHRTFMSRQTRPPASDRPAFAAARTAIALPASNPPSPDFHATRPFVSVCLHPRAYQRRVTLLSRSPPSTPLTSSPNSRPPHFD
ncbi:hypothetical protein B0H10DRAFT_2225461 [Mycena sp. CBHHK59/15]|nr:hypothetical protein B0H10DRAFT_2225461 [Mycena sp. CBHHK59/15]